MMQFPEHYNRVMPYLLLHDGEGFYDFTIAVFGATDLMRVMNASGGVQHGEINIGGSVIMFAEVPADAPLANAGLFIYVADVVHTLQMALTKGATEIMPISVQNYGKTCGIKDPFGNTWWVTQHLV